MKKLMASIALLTCCLASSVTFANNNLCIALLNYDTAPVKFTTAVDPGYEPVVQPNENKILPGDFMVGCSKEGCDIFIHPIDGKKFTEINPVPRGAQIVYVSPQQYYLNVNANIQCP